MWGSVLDPNFAGGAALAALSALSALSVAGLARADCEFVGALAALPRLASLCAAGCSVRGPGLARLAAGCPGLTQCAPRLRCKSHAGAPGTVRRSTPFTLMFVWFRQVQPCLVVLHWEQCRYATALCRASAGAAKADAFMHVRCHNLSTMFFC